MTKKSKKQPKVDRGQSSLFDLDGFTEEEKKELDSLILVEEPQNQHISHDNHIVDSDKLKDETKKDWSIDDPNLRSEQIIVSKDNYPFRDVEYGIIQSIDSFSSSCHKSKNLFNQCLYQIRQAFFGKLSLNIKGEKERKLRIDARNELDKYKNARYDQLKEKNYKNSIYKLLDKYFKDESKKRDLDSKERDNYSWSPQAAQQIIDMAVEAWLDNDLARRDYKENPDHRADYTGEPGLVGYIKKKSEYISVFTNQQCNIETKNVLIIESMNETRMRYEIKNFLTFPDHMNIRPIETRLKGNTDLREVRVIPLIKKGYYKIELIIKKVIDKIKIGDKFISLKEIGLDPLRIIGIDTGQENVVTIADNIGLSPIIIKGGVILSINQWFDKMGSITYKTYYRQQKHEKGKKEPIMMGSKMQKLSFDRTNKMLDIIHKISRYIVNYCIINRIGTIVWGRNPGWKQKINLGKRTNQKFTKIPHYLLFKMMKYKAEEIGIKVIDVIESHTSKCSFPDLEAIGYKEKGQYLGKRGKTGQKLPRGAFRTAKGIILNSDVNAAYNMIRKVFPDAFRKFIRNGKLMIKAIGIDTSSKEDEGVVLHPLRLSVSDLFRGPNACIGQIGVNVSTAKAV
jgi:putative transposase